MDGKILSYGLTAATAGSSTFSFSSALLGYTTIGMSGAIILSSMICCVFPCLFCSGIGFWMIKKKAPEIKRVLKEVNKSAIKEKELEDSENKPEIVVNLNQTIISSAKQNILIIAPNTQKENS
jgi:hypothetical protein